MRNIFTQFASIYTIMIQIYIKILSCAKLDHENDIYLTEKHCANNSLNLNHKYVEVIAKGDASSQNQPDILTIKTAENEKENFEYEECYEKFTYKTSKNWSKKFLYNTLKKTEKPTMKIPKKLYNIPKYAVDTGFEDITAYTLHLRSKKNNIGDKKDILLELKYILAAGFKENKEYIIFKRYSMQDNDFYRKFYDLKLLNDEIGTFCTNYYQKNKNTGIMDKIKFNMTENIVGIYSENDVFGTLKINSKDLNKYLLNYFQSLCSVYKNLSCRHEEEKQIIDFLFENFTSFKYTICTIFDKEIFENEFIDDEEAFYSVYNNHQNEKPGFKSENKLVLVDKLKPNIFYFALLKYVIYNVSSSSVLTFSRFKEVICKIHYNDYEKNNLCSIAYEATFKGIENGVFDSRFFHFIFSNSEFIIQTKNFKIELIKTKHRNKKSNGKSIMHFRFYKGVLYNNSDIIYDFFYDTRKIIANKGKFIQHIFFKTQKNLKANEFINLGKLYYQYDETIQKITSNIMYEENEIIQTLTNIFYVIYKFTNPNYTDLYIKDVCTKNIFDLNFFSEIIFEDFHLFSNKNAELINLIAIKAHDLLKDLNEVNILHTYRASNMHEDVRSRSNFRPPIISITEIILTKLKGYSIGTEVLQESIIEKHELFLPYIGNDLIIEFNCACKNLYLIAIGFRVFVNKDKARWDDIYDILCLRKNVCSNQEASCVDEQPIYMNESDSENYFIENYVAEEINDVEVKVILKKIIQNKTMISVFPFNIIHLISEISDQTLDTIFNQLNILINNKKVKIFNSYARYYIDATLFVHCLDNIVYQYEMFLQGLLMNVFFSDLKPKNDNDFINGFSLLNLKNKIQDEINSLSRELLNIGIKIFLINAHQESRIQVFNSIVSNRKKSCQHEELLINTLKKQFNN